MLAAAATSLGCAAAFGTTPATLIAAFFAFEACVGLYFPSMGTLRSQYLPDEHRGVIMNLFQVGRAGLRTTEPNRFIQIQILYVFLIILKYEPLPA